MRNHTEDRTQIVGSVHAHTPRGNSQILEHQFTTHGGSQQSVAVCFFVQGFAIVLAIGNQLQPAFGSLIAFHVAKKKGSLLATLFDESGMADMSAACQVGHRRVVFSTAKNNEGVQVPGLHEGIKF